MEETVVFKRLFGTRFHVIEEQYETLEDKLNSLAALAALKDWNIEIGDFGIYFFNEQERILFLHFEYDEVEKYKMIKSIDLFSRVYGEKEVVLKRREELDKFENTLLQLDKLAEML